MKVERVIAIVTFLIIILNLLIPNVTLAIEKEDEKIENNSVTDVNSTENGKNEVNSTISKEETSNSIGK